MLLLRTRSISIGQATVGQQEAHLDIEITDTIDIEDRWRISTTLVPEVDFPEENL